MSAFTYRVQSIDTGFLAECVEMGVAAEGATKEKAVEELQKALVEKLEEPNAMAPPSNPKPALVTLTEAITPEREPEPQGPGEAE